MNTTFRPSSAGTVNLEKVMQPQVFHAPVVVQHSQVAIPSNIDMSEVNRLRGEMRSMTASQLGSYQPPASQAAAKIGDELLKLAKANDIDVLETKFADIIKKAKGVDLTKLSNPKKGLFAKVTNFFADAKEEVIKSQSNAADYIERTFGEIAKNANAVASRVQVLEQMHLATQQRYVEYDYLIAAGRLEVEQRAAELEQLKVTAQQDAANINLQSQLQEAQFYLQQLEIKVGNDVSDQQMAFNLLPQIRLMQSNALTIGQTFTTIRGSVMNNWKQQFALSLIGNEQQRAAVVQNAVLDMNNELARNNAKALRQTTNEVAKANQRGVYDIGTLEFVHNETIGSFEDMFKHAQEGRANRQKIETACVTMKQQMVQRFASL